MTKHMCQGTALESHECLDEFDENECVWTKRDMLPHECRSLDGFPIELIYNPVHQSVTFSGEYGWVVGMELPPLPEIPHDHPCRDATQIPRVEVFIRWSKEAHEDPMNQQIEEDRAVKMSTPKTETPFDFNPETKHEDMPLDAFVLSLQAENVRLAGELSEAKADRDALILRVHEKEEELRSLRTLRDATLVLRDSQRAAQRAISLVCDLLEET